MGLILNIESSTTNCSVSLSRDGNLIHCIEKNQSDFKQSDYLHKFIDKLLVDCEISISNLDAVSISKGPGSFTGLRIGTASAKGFCYSCDIPLIAINTLKILAAGYKTKNKSIIIPLIDARRMEVYSMVLNNEYEILRETKAEILKPNSFSEYYSNIEIVILGTGAKKCKSILDYNKIKYPRKNIYPSSKNMIEISELLYKNKNYQDIAYFEPFYLKDFHTNFKK